MPEATRSIRGMHDLLPAQISVWQSLEATVKQVFAAYGFAEIRVPLLEKTEVFTRAIGQATDVVEKEMYTFSDRNGDSLSLRPEGTAGVVRAAIQNGLLYGAPLRVWYAGPMFRHERPQLGRLRQFHQAGAEVFGAQGPDVDAELLAMANRIWTCLGLTNLELQINSLGNARERSEYRQALVAWLEPQRDELDADTQARLARNPLRVLDSKDPKVQALLADAPLLSDYLGTESRLHLDGLRRLLDGMGIAYTMNPRLVRGLDYYCHSVFEWTTTELGAQGTICAGGRYDGLVELQGGNPWPATGFAMGLERLVALLEQRGAGQAEALHAYLVLAGTEAELQGRLLAERLRDRMANLRLVCNAGGGSFKTQFKRADRSGAQLALILGDDELAAGQITIKHLRSEVPQETVGLDSLDIWLTTWLANHAG